MINLFSRSAERISDINVKEDVSALISGEDLSEEFKIKAATIFEAAVKTRIKEQTKILEAQFDEKLASETETVKEAMVEKVDSYLNYVVEEWMKEITEELDRHNQANPDRPAHLAVIVLGHVGHRPFLAC